MKNYPNQIRQEAYKLFNNTFNCLDFELLKKAIGEDTIIDYIEKPSEEILRKEAKDNFDEKEWEEKTEEEKEEATLTFFEESEHYPMWSTVFEAKDEFISRKIMRGIDELYNLGIGVIAPTEYTNACLFIAGAGYDFYDAHWIPLFIHWGWIDEEKMKEEEERNKIKLTDWKEFGETLEKLTENRDKTIKRHSKGLLKALKL
ncbi:MAG: hypothetical protein ACTSPV_05920 [Candidatus Hodarchaeales archaeon]